MPDKFWSVYNYVARQWYETEYGQIEQAQRIYHPTMLALERLACGLPMFPEN
jgi:hypothetical protein